VIPVTHRRGQHLYVFGLARSGLAAVGALAAGGAHVTAWDDREGVRQAAAAAGAELAAPELVDWSNMAALVLSPGVALTHPRPHPVVERARAHIVPVIGDIELFVREVLWPGADARLIAVTGTNGKSTTTALIGHLLGAAGRAAQVGGNIGGPVLALSPPVNHTLYVIELSSYQLDLTPSLRPDVAVVLNVTPDHLDRHGDLAAYAAVKARIFAHQGAGDTLVLGADDAITSAMAASVPAGVGVITISQATPQPGGVWADRTTIIDDTEGGRRPICDLAGHRALRGAHNLQNAAAAVAAARAVGLGAEAIADGLATFAGLAHRMEEVARDGRVLVVNDSKATNAEAAEKAIVCFDAIHWIAGGQAKAGGIAALAPHFPRIARAYLIGEAAGEFAATLAADGVDHVVCGELAAATAAALADARASAAPEPVVLLSPACASFDQFADFEDRGRAFRAAVAAVLGSPGRAS
jgi:UDP-N-acetylmuramoylalanine--D-glutamate ligase